MAVGNELVGEERLPEQEALVRAVEGGPPVIGRTEQRHERTIEAHGKSAYAGYLRGLMAG